MKLGILLCVLGVAFFGIFGVQVIYYAIFEGLSLTLLSWWVWGASVFGVTTALMYNGVKKIRAARVKKEQHSPDSPAKTEP